MSNEELKAAALDATPGPWVFVDDDWSDGDHANITSAERSDSSIIDIAQVNGGGTASDFDEPFRTEQQANTAFIAAANPAVVLALLAELEAKDKHIAELEGALDVSQGDLSDTEDAMHLWAERAKAAEAKLATPVRLKKVDSSNVPFAGDGFNAAVDYCAKAIRAAGFTVEGDE